MMSIAYIKPDAHWIYAKKTAVVIRRVKMQRQPLGTSTRMRIQIHSNCASILILLAFFISWCNGLTNIWGSNYQKITKGARCTCNPELAISVRCHIIRLNRTTDHQGMELLIKPGIVIEQLFVSKVLDVWLCLVIQVEMPGPGG